MKIIEGLKLSKELQVKADDLRKKIEMHAAHLSIETPVYKDQRAQVAEWLQAHYDILQEIAALRIRVARTNLATQVDLQLGGKTVTKSITEWIIRRKELAPLDHKAWSSLGDRGLKEQNLQTTAGGPVTEVRIVRCFDPKERDTKVELYRSEPGVIDRTLEVVNATTDLLPAA
jgi:hypothetical protein